MNFVKRPSPGQLSGAFTLKMPAYRPRGNYSYVTARVKGKKKNLLTTDAYPKLMKMGTSQIARLLSETTYHDEITALASKYSGSELIERAINMNLARTYTDIIGFSKGRLQEAVDAYLDRWNVLNVKTVIRGIHHQIPHGEIMDALIPAGSISERFLEHLSDAESVEALFAEFEQAGLQTPPDGIIEDFIETGSLCEIEDFYDKNYYRLLLESIKGNSKPQRIYRNFVKHEIDILNAKNLWKLMLEDFDNDNIVNYMVPGGESLSMDLISELVHKEPGDVLEAISTALDIHFSSSCMESPASIACLELDFNLMKLSEKLSRIYPLSILPVIDYIIRKEKEVHFIKIIVNGKENNLSEERIRGLLGL